MLCSTSASDTKAVAKTGFRLTHQNQTTKATLELKTRRATVAEADPLKRPDFELASTFDVAFMYSRWIEVIPRQQNHSSANKRTVL